jgi:hypothetical protein
MTTASQKELVLSILSVISFIAISAISIQLLHQDVSAQPINNTITTNITKNNSTAANMKILNAITPHLHKIDQKWIDYSVRFMRMMRSIGEINSSNAYEYHLFNAEGLLMSCINYEIDSNNTTSILFLPLCDDAIYKEYIDPHGYGQPIDQILSTTAIGNMADNTPLILSSSYTIQSYVLCRFPKTL